MLRLTLRSAHDGRFLARVIDRGGSPFVLDFGEAPVIADLAQRIQHGFPALAPGRNMSATPMDVDLIVLLANTLAAEGFLVFLEQPDWPSRSGKVADEAPMSFDDDRTELVDLPPPLDLDRIPDVGAAMRTVYPLDELEPLSLKPTNPTGSLADELGDLGTEDLETVDPFDVIDPEYLRPGDMADPMRPMARFVMLDDHTPAPPISAERWEPPTERFDWDEVDPSGHSDIAHDANEPSYSSWGDEDAPTEQAERPPPTRRARTKPRG